jgi:hypothetical protein
MMGAIISVAKVTLNIFSKPSYILFSLLVLIFLSKEPLENIHAVFRTKNIILTYPLFSFILLSGLFFIPRFSMGIEPPMHVNNLITLLFILLWFFYLVIAGKYFYDKFPAFLNRSSTNNTCITLFAIVLFYTGAIKTPSGYHYFGNSINAWNDLLFKAEKYEAEMQHRYKLVRKARSENIELLIFDPIKSRPETVFFIDITTEPEDWINKSFAGYYQVKAVKINDQKIN